MSNQGEVKMLFILKSPNHRIIRLHLLATYVLIMIGRIITIMGYCNCVKESQLFFKKIIPHIPDGELKELRRTDL